ncbi:PREDICTED: uncharacterized protein LOC103606254 [Galeopterus variegatus]|uniref:Uncharacterized protein LOC103606254 n=1 Tax=Galeopterus variegatus TaxID=482537 RepID=A0ABM0S892_GALVR|nr:PREDICTED: uncharacterized protein LOC103606254 [Galeopterus variegatus]
MDSGDMPKSEYWLHHLIAVEPRDSRNADGMERAEDAEETSSEHRCHRWRRGSEPADGRTAPLAGGERSGKGRRFRHFRFRRPPSRALFNLTYRGGAWRATARDRSPRAERPERRDSESPLAERRPEKVTLNLTLSSRAQRGAREDAGLRHGLWDRGLRQAARGRRAGVRSRLGGCDGSPGRSLSLAWPWFFPEIRLRSPRAEWRRRREGGKARTPGRTEGERTSRTLEGIDGVWKAGKGRCPGVEAVRGGTGYLQKELGPASWREERGIIWRRELPLLGHKATSLMLFQVLSIWGLLDN